MAQEAFTGGVEPGGLWTQNDVRILLCYVLASVEGPLSRESIAQIVQEKALANYFETAEALEALLRQGRLRTEGEGLYTVTDSGREIAAGLFATLPRSVRDKALEAALRLSAEARSRRENRVEISEDPEGCRVLCRIGDGRRDLMEVSLLVPDREQAALVERNFYADPGAVYKLLLSALTGDGGYARSYFEERDG